MQSTMAAQPDIATRPTATAGTGQTSRFNASFSTCNLSIVPLRSSFCGMHMRPASVNGNDWVLSLRCLAHAGMQSAVRELPWGATHLLIEPSHVITDGADNIVHIDEGSAQIKRQHGLAGNGFEPLAQALALRDRFLTPATRLAQLLLQSRLLGLDPSATTKTMVKIRPRSQRRRC